VQRYHLLRSLSLALLALASACTASRPHDDAPCAELRTVRVCWDERCPDGVCVTPRARVRAVAAFACAGQPTTCVQRHPRRPDDGEWECLDVDGIVLCRGGEPAAGVVPGPPDEGWICRGEGERHCVDLAPDQPDDGTWRCHFEGAREGARVCERSTTAEIGDRCVDGAQRCPAGMRCAARVCVPSAAPQPSCWVDGDCGAGKRCLRGTCAERAR